MNDVIFGRMGRVRFLAMGVIALLALFVQPVAAAPGDLDTTFGTGGKVITPIGGVSASAGGVLVQQDGKIVVTGSSRNSNNNDITLVRYNANGSLDTSFGNAGKVTTDVSGDDDGGISIALQSNGKIVVTGYSFNNCVLLRYNSNGSLDSSFGSGGKVITAFGSLNDAGMSVVLQGDGRIVVAGRFSNGLANSAVFVLVRYDTNGSLDTSFGSEGIVNTSISRFCTCFSTVIQNDGKIVVAGYALAGNHTDFALVRYNRDGTLDNSFGSDGKITTAVGSNYDHAYSVVVQGDGKIIVAGDSNDGAYYDFALVRYTTTGALDTSFGSGGKVTTPIGSGDDKGQSVAVQSDGKIVVAGNSNGNFALVRYNASGALDPNFGSGGKVTTLINSDSYSGHSLVLQSNGKIVVAGSSQKSNGYYDFAVMRYMGDTPFAISGTVRDGAGLPVAGASVTLKRNSTVYWQGTSAANGMFQDAAASVGSYTVVATKTGYQTYLSNFDWTGGGNQSLNVTLNALPAPLTTVTTNQTPPASAVGTCRTWSQTDADAPKLLLLQVNGQFTSSLTNLNANRATVVITHGWNSNATDTNAWPKLLATLIQQHNTLGASAPNILAWDWQKDAAGSRPPTDRTSCDGVELGKALLQSLGTGYNQRVHFIGHSLGTIVNAYACDYVHGSFARNTNNPTVHWDSTLTRPHITLFDEAEVASVFGSQFLTSADAAWKAAQIKKKLIAGVDAAATLAATWKSPIPRTSVAWIDNYISAVGFHRDEAVNVCLLSPTLTLNTQPGANLTQQLTDAHSYSHLWYRNTIGHNPATPQPSFGSSFEAGGALPPSAASMAAGSDWYEHLATGDPFDLTRNPSDLNPVGLVVANTDFPILLGLTLLPGIEAVAQDAYNVTFLPLDETGKAVLRGYDAGIKWAGDIGGTVIYKTGQVVTATKEKVGIWWDATKDAGSNFLNSIDPSALITGPVAAPVISIVLSNQSVAPAPSAIGVAAAPPVNQPAYAWLTVNVPANAGMIAFDFTVTGDPVDDSIACAVNGQNIFTLPAKFAPDGSPVSTDMMDISAYAGLSVELFFGLVGGTSTNCQVAIDGIRFITIPQPKVGLAANGPNVLVKWPAAAVGWILETSTTLAPNSWQPVPLVGVTVASGVATIEQPVSGAKRFYRLRRSP